MNLKDNKKNPFPHPGGGGGTLNFKKNNNVMKKKKKDPPPPPGGGGESKVLHEIRSHETEYNNVDTSVTISYKIT